MNCGLALEGLPKREVFVILGQKEGSLNLVKIPYICGPLTELPSATQEEVKRLYATLADVCQEVLGTRAFVPHEHFDPIRHANFTPAEVDKAERTQVCERTSVLVVVAIEPTWGGGIEVEMAYRSQVPVVILKPPKNISRLLRGNPGVRAIVEFQDFNSAQEGLAQELKKLVAIPKAS